MPYTMFIYDINDDAAAPTVGDVFRVSEVVPNVMDLGMFGGTGTHVVLEPVLPIFETEDEGVTSE